MINHINSLCLSANDKNPASRRRINKLHDEAQILSRSQTHTAIITYQQYSTYQKLYTLASREYNEEWSFSHRAVSTSLTYSDIKTIIN